MKGQIIIEYIGKFTEEDLKEEARIITDEIIDASNEEIGEPKFDKFNVSYKVIK